MFDMFNSRNVNKYFKYPLSRPTTMSDQIVGLRECWLSNLSDILGRICPTWEYERWYTWSTVAYIESYFYVRDRHVHHRMVVWFTTTCAISVYHHKSCDFESRSWRGVLDTTLCDKVCQWLVTCWCFSLPRYNWNIVESGIKPNISCNLFTNTFRFRQQ